MMPRILTTILAWFWLLPTTGGAEETDYRIELKHGSSETIRQFDLAESAVIVRDPSPRTIPFSEIVSIRTVDFLADWSQRPTLIWLSNDDRLVGEPTAIDDDSMTVRWRHFPASEPLTIPLEIVAALCLQTPGPLGQRQKLFRNLAAERQRGDVAWLTSGDRVAGEFTGLARGEYLFRTDAGKLPILRAKLLALRFDPELVAELKPVETRYLLTFSDGSRLTARSVERSAERTTFTTVFGQTVILPSAALLGLQVFSPTIQSLSERKPETVQITPFLGGERSIVSDRNVLHGPLQIRGRESAIGLGVSSRSVIHYALEPNDREFRATVGIDDAAEGAGHAIFTVAVDDRVVWTSPALTGNSEPVTIPPVNLRGGKRLTLTVEFGEHGDVRDYADWCEAILLRSE